MNENFTKEDAYMANKYMKIYSTSLALREMQIKTIKKYFYISTYSKMLTPPSTDKDVEHLEFSDTAAEDVKEYSHFGKTIWQFLKKLNIHIPCDPAITPFPTRNEIINSYKDLYEYVNIQRSLFAMTRN